MGFPSKTERKNHEEIWAVGDVVSTQKISSLLQLRAISFKPIFSAHRHSVTSICKTHKSNLEPSDGS